MSDDFNGLFYRKSENNFINYLKALGVGERYIPFIFKDSMNVEIFLPANDKNPYKGKFYISERYGIWRNDYIFECQHVWYNHQENFGSEKWSQVNFEFGDERLLAQFKSTNSYYCEIEWQLTEQGLTTTFKETTSGTVATVEFIRH